MRLRNMVDEYAFRVPSRARKCNTDRSAKMAVHAVTQPPAEDRSMTRMHRPFRHVALFALPMLLTLGACKSEQQAAAPEARPTSALYRFV